MTTYTALKNLAAGDVLTEAWVDGVLTNFSHLHAQNSVYTARGEVTTTTTTYADVAGLSAVHTAYGGLATMYLALNAGASGSGQIHLFHTLNVDGTTVVETETRWISNYNNSGTVVIPYHTALASGVHTIKTQWKMSGVAGAPGTAKIGSGWLMVAGG